MATNLLVAGLGLVVGWLGIEVAGREIERKLVDEAVVDVATQISENKWPLTDDLLKKVALMLGDEAAAGPADRREITAGSLAAAERDELLSQFAHSPLPQHVVLAGKSYRMAVATLPPTGNLAGGEATRLCLLVPVQRITSAKARAARTIALLTVAAVALATVLSVWWSHSITRPLRQLAARMDRLSRAAEEMELDSLLASELSSSSGSPSSGGGPTASRGPREIGRLTESYDRLMAQLAEARSRLARSARMATLGQMSASLAHELRNPLSGIKMNARVLADELARHNLQDESLDIIRREIDRMEAYLKELLDLAVRDDAPPSTMHAPPAIRLDELADSVVSLLNGRCRHASITVERRYDRAALAAAADAAKVRQVILNLALNAIDAMPTGGTLGLTVEGCEDGVRLAVTDTGGGVRVPEGVDIFEPFVTGKRGGTGLGLHVCRTIIQQHGGRIGYESSDRGSTFWLVLPGARE
ncbi:MAG: HAMP domain-containing histidine kinase [Planctomycetes bacterium]|nr:HAMP domain-containing histidine kinase [Planctomycetota bacterium]